MLLFSSFPQIGLREPGKHVLAIAFFTPPGEEIRRNETKYLDVTATDGGEDVYSSAGDDGEEDASGQAYIFSCPYSSLCRQVVTDSRGRVAQFDFPRGDDARVRLGNGDDEDLVLGVDSIVAIPLQDWSIDYVTPRAKCTRSAAEGGQCVQDEFPAPPEGSQVISFVGPGAEVSLIIRVLAFLTYTCMTPPQSADTLPPGLLNPDTQLIRIDPGQPLLDVTGTVPEPGVYVLVANYFQPGPSTYQKWILAIRGHRKNRREGES